MTNVSIIDIPTADNSCRNSGFDMGDVRTFESNDGQAIQQVTCVNFSQQCTGNIDKNTYYETQQCIVDNYVVLANVLP